MLIQLIFFFLERSRFAANLRVQTGCSRFQELVAGNVSDSLFVVMSECEVRPPRCSQLPAIFTSGVAHLCLSHTVTQYWSQFRESFSNKLSALKNGHEQVHAANSYPGGRCVLPLRSLLCVSAGSLSRFPAVLLQCVDFHHRLRPQQVGSERKRGFLRWSEGKLPVPGNITMSGQGASSSFLISSFSQSPLMLRRTAGSTRWRCSVRCQFPALESTTSVDSPWS